MAALPQLTTTTDSPRVFARILRAALKNQTIALPLERTPTAQGAHLLHVVLTGETSRAVWLMAWPHEDKLRLQPRSEVQAAQLFALAQLGGPTSEPPPAIHAGSDVTILESSTIYGTASAQDARRATVQMNPHVAAPVAPPPPPADPLVGRVIAGRYRLESLLGRGATGAVYRGVHVELGRDVAVKILHATNRKDPRFVKRFEAEAKAASRLDHAHVTRVLDFGEEPREGLLYLVMEYVAGRTLESVLVESGRVAIPRAIDITMQVASALSRAHAEGVIHRDVKPENIMLVRQSDDDELEAIEIVKVCDFGVAKLMTPDADSDLTIAGSLLGSPLYMSPEQIRGERLDPRTDVYSLGVTLYEITTGRPPFEADTLEALMEKHVAEPPPPPSRVIAGYDPELEELVLRMLSKTDEARPDARTLRTELRALVIRARTGALRSERR